MWKGLSLEKIPRMVRFPYPVRSIGHTVRQGGQTVKKYHFTRTDHVEFCIRYNCADPFVVDEVDGVPYKAGFPHVAVKMPDSYHLYRLNQPRDAVDFSYSLDIMAKLKDAGLLPETPVFEIAITPPLDMMMRELTDLMEHSREYSVADRIDLLCFRILEELLFIRRKSTEEDSSMQKIRQTASFFQIHFLEELDLDQIARNNGMSRCTFYRQWNRCFQQTPAHYLLSLKMDWAARNLTQTNRKVTDLAAELHYHSAAYFCEIFEKYFGITPFRYRRRHSLQQNSR